MEHNTSFFQKHATSSKNVENMSSVPDERRKKRGLFVYKVSDRVPNIGPDLQLVMCYESL